MHHVTRADPTNGILDFPSALKLGDLKGKRVLAGEVFGEQAIRQAHFIRDFKAVAGVPPEVYRQRQRKT